AQNYRVKCQNHVALRSHQHETSSGGSGISRSRSGTHDDNQHSSQSHQHPTRLQVHSSSPGEGFKVQGFKVAKVSKFQSCKGFKVSELQVSRFQSFKVTMFPINLPGRDKAVRLRLDGCRFD